MKDRIADVFVVIIVSVLLVPASPAGQGTARPVNTGNENSVASNWSVPRTSWGDPDLQGIWNNAVTTPMERLTDEEAVARKVVQPEAVRRKLVAETGPPAGWSDPGRPTNQPFLVVDPPDGRIPMKPEAIRRLVAKEAARRGRGEADSWLDRSPWERCISRTLPTAMIADGYNANYQVLQTPDHVAILVEMVHEARIIPLDKRPHIAPQIRQWFGDSRGRWEGDTLVVETTNFVDRLDGGELLPSHPQRHAYRGSGATLRLTERFRRVADKTIDYRFTVEDPNTFTRPYTVSIPMTKDDNQTGLVEYSCHEGNLAMVGMLAGARANEEAAIEAAEIEARERVESGHPGLAPPAAPTVPDLLFKLASEKGSGKK
jgi:hypothetical protein